MTSRSVLTRADASRQQGRVSIYGKCISAPDVEGLCLHLPHTNRPTSYNFLSTTTPLHPLLWPFAPLLIMDAIPRTDKSSEASVHHGSSDRSPGEPIPLMPLAPDDTTTPGSAQQPQTQVTVFTLFQRLPAELRVLVWEFACAPPGPRIHFLEPIADPDDEGRGPFWHQERQWRENYCHGCERTPRIHWEISERTNGPCLQWSGRELLSVCIEARRVFLDQKTTSLTSRGEQPRVGFSEMAQTEDIICTRASHGYRDDFTYPLNTDFGERQTGFCHRDERPSPRRLALEVPVAFESLNRRDRFDNWLMPKWLFHYGCRQKFMRFDRLEIVYVLDQHITPRAHYDQQQVMPPDMYTEAFDGHHGSKFVAIDPEDEQAVELWNIPKHCWDISGFPYFPTLISIFDVNDGRHFIVDGHIPKVKLRFLACVRESSQTQQLDDESPNSGFAFT